MKTKKLIFVAVALLSAIALAACSEPIPESPDEILAQAANVTLVKYDLVGPFSDESQITRVWMKENMMKTEAISEGQTVQTYLLDLEAETVYTWHSPDNIPLELGISPWEVADFTSAMNFADMIASSNPTIIGTETTDGKDCFVVECVDEKVTRRAWVWKKHNFLVRLDFITTEHSGTIEFKNIDFSDIDDSVFQLPEVSP